MHLLRVRVFSGRNLLGADMAGKSDPYVQLQVGNKKLKTKVKKGNCNPDWMETKDFPLEDGPTGQLLITVKDHDYIGSDDVLGVAVLEIADFILPLGVEKFRVLSLNGGEAGENVATILSNVIKTISPIGGKKEIRNHGSLSIGLAVHECPAPRPVDYVAPSGPYAQAGQPCVLKIIAEGAARLNAADFGTSPKSDPYCQFTVQKKKWKTKSIKKTLQPHWHQEFTAPVPDGAADFLLVKVKDRDLIGRSDSLGEVRVDLGAITLNTEHIMTLRLQGGDIGENVKMAAGQVADDAEAAVVCTTARVVGGKAGASVAAKATGKGKNTKGPLSGARTNYGAVCIRITLQPAP